jgi:hypothetical protein
MSKGRDLDCVQKESEGESAANSTATSHYYLVCAFICTHTVQFNTAKDTLAGDNQGKLPKRPS